ncbi:MAG: hypothetical protein E5Y02_33845 [Mesorhizobium sp.]|nr:MAG: hypothetical protein E5Y06_33450 [Mesorhizobium sp.]TJU93827.1 MAG: hypothetical protein E5Y08_32590 [Mesorhizobium sp.]TJV13373.1 MAG: hypothetical protein E5Y07_31800 [Mesorhizobium sp.]TJV37039.1 MAG: hypothetical protein E5Y02_33845 [Mesorhizobium sp.]
MTKLSDLGPPVLGKRHGARGNGPDNFYSCATCGQKVDMRDFRQVMWHEQPNHEKSRKRQRSNNQLPEAAEITPPCAPPARSQQP